MCFEGGASVAPVVIVRNNTAAAAIAAVNLADAPPGAASAATAAATARPFVVCLGPSAPGSEVRGAAAGVAHACCPCVAVPVVVLSSPTSIRGMAAGATGLE